MSCVAFTPRAATTDGLFDLNTFATLSAGADEMTAEFFQILNF